jgi:hypothetical protein
MVQDRTVNKNRNWLCIVCGETGSGKSYSAISLAKLIDKEFNIDKLVFKADDFLKLLNSGKLKRGDCIIWDEAGVGLPSREWYSISNKAIGYLLQTFRNLNLAVIFTTPNLGYIDNQARCLFHSYIQTERIDYKKNIAVCKLFFVDVDSKKGKVYYKYPRFNIQTPDGYSKMVVIKELYIDKPTDDLIKAYELKKKAYTTQLNLGLEREVNTITRDAKTGRPGKLSTTEAEFIIKESKKRGMTQTKILRAVQKQYGTKVSVMTISRLISRDSQIHRI